jgi:ATP phosphoribosyltransferase regulatory subunit HisZ
MIGSISNASMPMQVRPTFLQAMSDKQITALRETLAGYDPQNLTKNDVRSIQEALRSSDIRPSRQLHQVMQASGFDAEALRPTVEEGRGAVSGEGKLTAELPKEIMDMFKNLAKGGGGDAELANARTMLQDKGYSTQGHLVDLVI